MSNVKTARDTLARAKAYFTRHDTERALESTVAALRIIVSGKANGPGRQEVDGMVREIVTLLNRTEEILAHYPKGIGYRKDIEKPLFGAYSKILKEMKEAAERKSHEEILTRKQKIDKNLNFGKKLLQAGKLKDAQELFDEAVTLYVDEHILFRLMGQACMEAKQAKMALRYLKKAMKVDPDNHLCTELTVQAYKDSGNIPAAAKLEAQLKK